MSTSDDRSAFEQWEVVELAAAAEASAAAERAAELERLRETARAEGYAEGLAAGRQEAEQACSRMKQLAESFGNTLDNFDFRLSDMLLALALDVARQVVAGELAARPERILDVVNLALKQMAESTREARLLLTPEDLRKFKDTETALDEVVDRIGALKSESDRAAIAEKLGLGPLATALREGADEVARLRDEAQSLGFVMDESLVRKGAEAQGKMEDLAQIIGVQLAGAFIDLSDEVLTFTGYIADAISGLNRFIERFSNFKANTNAMYGDNFVQDVASGNSWQALKSGFGSVFSGRTARAAGDIRAGNSLPDYGTPIDQSAVAAFGVTPRAPREPRTGLSDVLTIPPGRTRTDNSAQRAAEREARRAERVEQEIFRARQRLLQVAEDDILTAQQRYDLAREQLKMDREARAADHDDGDDVEQVGAARCRLGRVEARGHEQPRDGREEAGDRVHGELRATDGDAAQSRDLLVAADRVERAPARAEAQPERGDEEHEHEDDALKRDSRETRGGEGEEPVGEAVDGVAARHEHGQARGGRHRGERRDEGLELAVGREHAVEEADERPHEQAHGQRELEGPAGVSVQPAHAHHAQGEHSADREVDAADDDDEKGADRHDADGRDLGEDVEQVARRQEVGRHERQRDEDHDEAHERSRDP